MVRIFTETLSDVKFRSLDQSAFPDLVVPVICLIRTDSYSAPEISSFEKLLSAQEQEKAVRFRFLRDHNSYIITHGVLRKILGNYLGSEPSEIEFISNKFGKPYLDEKYKKIYFNLSHSSECSVLAFSTKSETGIDVEKIDPEFNFDLIAKVHFSEAEKNFLYSNQHEACKKFYTLWTRKEAFLKTLGIGIGENLDVEVFRNENHWNPKTVLPGIRNSDYYLSSLELWDKFLITTAGSRQEEINCIMIDGIR